ncbi:zinc finger protein 250 [Scomber scombrus]|uniref:Zinc finger protein 250 n=1 Tax=Scomber scombrus TaxID=13677 RepID=A0AAV1P927_SCOSC|nr:zinc finger protein 37 [Scomber scombrus]
MSAYVVDIQAQVESVLAALVKVAAVELTKLFESRCPTAAVDDRLGRAEDGKKNGTAESLSTEDSKRSIGVQVDEDISPQLELSGPPLLSDWDCLRESREEVVVKGGFIPSDLLAEDKAHDDPERSPLKEQVVAETVEMVEFSILETECSTDTDPQTEAALHVSADLRHGSPQSSPAKRKLLVMKPDTNDVSSMDKVKFVCPLFLKPESAVPKPDSTEKPVKAEPQQACVSTAKGTAYSPSPSDGAVTPAVVKVWELTHTPNDKKNNLQMKLKLTTPEKKLTRPCTVQLVNMLTVPESEAKPPFDGANSKTRLPLPKDLRQHQGLHTGHRLCCFTSCGSGIWQLRKGVAHSRDGYACNVCQKTFKRRKILRRHERFHTGEKPYPCSKCSKTFALRKSLRRHFRFHTGERPHTCTQCGKSFRLRENLKAHLRFHTGDKPFSCNTCGKTFRITRNLEKHKLSRCGYFVPSFRAIAGIKL